MKFMLILNICSVLHLNCLPQIHDNFVFNSWSECANAGYLRAIRVTNSMDSVMVNSNKLIVYFECVEVKDS